MKRLLLLCLFILLILGCFLGCGKDSKEEETPPEEPAVTSYIATPPPVATAALVTVPTPAPEREPARPAYEAGIGFVNDSEVNIRAEASTNAEVLGQLPQNTMIRILKSDAGNGWSIVEYKEKEAYMSASYLTIVTGESTLPIQGTGTVNASDINMRSAATTDSDSVGKLSKGTKVNIVTEDVGHDWSLIQVDDRLVYVATRYIDVE